MRGPGFCQQQSKPETSTRRLVILVAALVAATVALGNFLLATGFNVGYGDGVPWHIAPQFGAVYLVAGLYAVLAGAIAIYRTSWGRPGKYTRNIVIGPHLAILLGALALGGCCLFAFGDSVGFAQGVADYSPYGTSQLLKPVIYLYPLRVETVTVRVLYAPGFSRTRPAYIPEKGWTVLARPDGTLEDLANDKTYPYLYWEGNPGQFVFNMHEGFVVSSGNTGTFLRTQLRTMGLNPAETDAFLSYWGSRLRQDRYNLIHFATTGYASRVPLQVDPAPESVLRVFMVYEPLAHPVRVTPQHFPVFHRRGFTVVEWGGTRI